MGWVLLQILLLILALAFLAALGWGTALLITRRMRKESERIHRAHAKSDASAAHVSKATDALRERLPQRDEP